MLTLLLLKIQIHLPHYSHTARSAPSQQTLCESRRRGSRRLFLGDGSDDSRLLPMTRESGSADKELINNSKPLTK